MLVNKLCLVIVFASYLIYGIASQPESLNALDIFPQFTDLKSIVQQNTGDIVQIKNENSKLKEQVQKIMEFLKNSREYCLSCSYTGKIPHM